MSNFEKRFSELNQQQKLEWLKRLRADRYKADLCALCRDVLDYPDIGRIHREMESLLHQRDKPRLFLVPRGHLKSSFITIGYTIQTLLNDPTKRVLISNATWDGSRKFLREIKNKITSERFIDLFGNIATPHWNMDEITVTGNAGTKESSVATTGVEKEITGQHYDLIICDDLVAKENSSTPDQIRKVISYYQSLIPILDPGADIILVGTRWHEMDLYGHILDKLRDNFHVFHRGLKDESGYIFPEKFNERQEELVRVNMSPALFASQYYNKPIAAAYQIFLKEYFNYYSRVPDNVNNIYTTVDLARSERHDSDETAIVTVGWTKESDMYVLEIDHGRWASEEKVKRIYAAYNKWKPQYIGIETDAQQAYFNDLLAMYQHLGKKALPIAKIRSKNKSKEERIGALEPLFRAGKVFLKEKANWTPFLEMQLLKYTPMGTHGHDDLTDALASQLQLYTPKITPIKESDWITEHKDEKKDLKYWANAVIWDKEKRIKEIKAEKKLQADENWFNDIADNYLDDLDQIFYDEL